MSEELKPCPFTFVKLLPCPFCGGHDLMIARGPYAVWCRSPGCKTRGPKLNSNPTRDAAITAWNTRTPDHTELVRQLVEALEEAEAIAKDHIKLLEEAKWTRAQAEEIILARTMLENMQRALTKAKEAGF